MIGIEGKIAEIIDTYTVVINRGHEHGVEEGMRFIIYELGNEIKDPDTKESLGTFEHVKAKVEATNVNERFSTAKTYEADTRPTNAIIAIMGMYAEQRVSRELPLGDEAKDRLPKHPITQVKVGDPVRQILD